MSSSPIASKVNRRDELLKVAIRLFGQRGFHGTSMGDIATETGLQKASLYHWVESKEDLLYHVLSGALDLLLVQARAVSGDERLAFEVKLRSLITLHSEYTVSHPDVMHVFLSEAKWLGGPRGREIRDVRKQYHRLYEDVFYEARERGEILAPANAVPVYVNLLFSMTNHLPVWFRQEGTYSPRQVADLVSDLVLRNVLPDQAQDVERRSNSWRDIAE